MQIHDHGSLFQPRARWPTKDILMMAAEDLFRLGPRQIIDTQRISSGKIYFLAGGMGCRNFRFSNDVGTSIISLVLPGDVVNLECILGLPCRYEVELVVDSEIGEIGPAGIAQLSRHPVHAHALLRSLFETSAKIAGRLAIMNATNARASIAYTLIEWAIELHHAQLYDDRGYHWPFCQRDLARASGRSVVHVNRLLGELRDRELIAYGRKRLMITNVERLASYCGLDHAGLETLLRV